MKTILFTLASLAIALPATAQVTFDIETLTASGSTGSQTVGPNTMTVTATGGDVIRQFITGDHWVGTGGTRLSITLNGGDTFTLGSFNYVGTVSDTVTITGNLGGNPVNSTTFSVTGFDGSNIYTGTFAAGTLPGVFDEIVLTDTTPALSAGLDDIVLTPAAANAAPAFDNGASDSLTVTEDDPATAINSLLAVTDADVGDTLTWTVDTAPTNGTLGGFPTSLSSTGSGDTPSGLTYTPTPDFFGNDSFVIEVSDGTLSDTITVNVTTNSLPEVTGVSVDDGTFTVGDSVTVRVTFDEAVEIDSGTPTISIVIDGNTRTATYSSGANTTELVFLYAIQPGDTGAAGDTNGVDVPLNSLTGNIQNSTGTSANLSHPAANDGGETINALLTIVISEIMYDPNNAEDNWEWVEVYNPLPYAIDLSGWVLDDENTTHHSAANIAAGTIPADSAAVLYNADDLTAAEFADAWWPGNLIAVTGWFRLSFNNNGDRVSLWSNFATYNADDKANPANAIATVDYGAAGFPDPVGRSIYLTDLAANPADGANWEESANFNFATPLGQIDRSNQFVVPASDTGSPWGFARTGAGGIIRFTHTVDGGDPNATVPYAINGSLSPANFTLDANNSDPTHPNIQYYTSVPSGNYTFSYTPNPALRLRGFSFSSGELFEAFGSLFSGATQVLLQVDEGDVVTFNFSYDPNTPPTLSATVPDQLIPFDPSASEINLGLYPLVSDDADSDAILTYEITDISGDSDVVLNSTGVFTPSGSQGTLTLQTGAPGVATVTLRISDRSTAFVEDTFQVTVTAPTSLVVDNATDEDDGNYSLGDLSLREAIDIIDDTGTITFAEALAGATLNNTGTFSFIDKGITIDGSTISSPPVLSGDSRFQVDEFILTLRGLIFEDLTDKIVLTDGGSVIVEEVIINGTLNYSGTLFEAFDADLTLTNVTLRDATFDGELLYTFETTTQISGLAVLNSTLTSESVLVDVTSPWGPETSLTNLELRDVTMDGSFLNLDSGEFQIDDLTADNVTFSNSSLSFIYVYGDSEDLSVENVTLVDVGVDSGTGSIFYIEDATLNDFENITVTNPRRSRVAVLSFFTFGTIQNVTISGGQGGGSEADLFTLDESYVFFENITVRNGDYWGGVIFLESESVAGVDGMLVENATFTDESLPIFDLGDADDDMRIDNVTIRDVALDSELLYFSNDSIELRHWVVDNVTVEANSTDALISLEDSASSEILNATLTDITFEGNGSLILVNQGFSLNMTDLNIRDITILSNDATNALLENFETNLTIVNSTLVSGGVPVVYNHFISSASVSVSIADSYLENTSSNPVLTDNGGEFDILNVDLNRSTLTSGGPVISSLDDDFSLEVILNNTLATRIPFTSGQPAISMGANSILRSINNNIIGGTVTAGIFIGTPANGNLNNIDPRLGPLQDNGLGRFSRLPASGSLAINGGSNAQSGGVAFDLHGNERITGGIIDIGAVEVQNRAPGITNGGIPDLNLAYGEDVSFEIYLYFEDDQTLDANLTLEVTALGDTTVIPGLSLPFDLQALPPTGPDGLISFRTGLPGTSTVEITATDQLGASTTQTFTVTVAAPTLLTVDDLGDTEDGNLSPGNLTLREAFGLIADNGTIRFAPALANQTLTVDSSVDPGSKHIIVDGSTLSQPLTLNRSGTGYAVFDVNGGSLTLRNLRTDGISFVRAFQTTGEGVVIDGFTLAPVTYAIGGSVISSNDGNLTLNGLRIDGGTFEREIIFMLEGDFQGDDWIIQNASIEHVYDLRDITAGSSLSNILVTANSFTSVPFTTISGQLDISDLHVYGNTYNASAIVEAWSSTVSLRDSLLVMEDGIGAALFNRASQVVVINSHLEGGGLFATQTFGQFGSAALTSLQHSTVVGNNLVYVNLGDPGILEATHTLFTRDDLNENIFSGVSGNPGTVDLSAGHNVIGNSTQRAGTFPVNYVGLNTPTNVVDEDPLLGSLQNNGGSFPTRLPLRGSPAVDAGNASFSAAAFTPILDLDLRTQPRVGQTGTIDIGAVEVRNIAPVASNALLSPDPARTGDNLTLTYDFSDLDSDSEMNSEILWTRNGTLMPSLNGSLTVPASETTRGEVWQATVRPGDGYALGLPIFSNPVTILNSPPVVVDSKTLAFDSFDGPSLNTTLWNTYTNDGSPFQGANTNGNPVPRIEQTSGVIEMNRGAWLLSTEQADPGAGESIIIEGVFEMGYFLPEDRFTIAVMSDPDNTDNGGTADATGESVNSLRFVFSQRDQTASVSSHTVATDTVIIAPEAFPFGQNEPIQFRVVVKDDQLSFRILNTDTGDTLERSASYTYSNPHGNNYIAFYNDRRHFIELQIGGLAIYRAMTSGDEDITTIGDLRNFVTDPDGDSLTFNAIAPTANGSLTINPDGTFVHAPGADFYGVEPFTYSVTDGAETIGNATHAVHLYASNDPPSDILPGTLNIQERISAPRVITILEVVDPDGSGYPFTGKYSNPTLVNPVAGAGSTHNNLFGTTLDGLFQPLLRQTQPIEIATTGRILSIRLQADDRSGGTFEKIIPILVDQTLFYVNADVTAGLGDGSSWANAYPSLADALVDASLSAANYPVDVWVAEGTYLPTTPAGRDATFNLVDNVSLFGGFAGGESKLADRDWLTNLTLLSGDLGTPDDTTDNAYHVVTFDGSRTNSALDGFTITGGNANGTSGNDGFGGGIFLNKASPRLTNLIVSGNTATQGGGLYAQSGTITLHNSDISKNTALSNGGGIATRQADLSIDASTIRSNTARLVGGGIFITLGRITISDSILAENEAGRGGGGLYNTRSQAFLNHVTVAANNGGRVGFGGGLYFDRRSGGTIDNTIIWGNTARGDRSIEALRRANIRVADSLVQDGWNGGARILRDDPLFIGTPAGSVEAYALQNTSPAISMANVATTTTTDLLGEPRLSTPDMGALEFAAAPLTVKRKGKHPSINAATIAQHQRAFAATRQARHEGEPATANTTANLATTGTLLDLGTNASDAETPPLHSLNGLPQWLGATTHTPEGWFLSPLLGTGWHYAQLTAEAQEGWLWSVESGWLWTSQQTFPLYYEATSQTWFTNMTE